MGTPRWRMTALVLALAACASAPAPEPLVPLRTDADGLGDVALVAPLPPDTAVVDAVLVEQALARVLELSHGLRVRGRAWCGRYQAGTLGLALRMAAADDQPVAVLHVAAGSPASKAGLRAGDTIEAFDGTAIPAGKDGLQGLQRAFERARLATRAVPVSLRRGNDAIAVKVVPEAACDFRTAVTRDGALEIGSQRVAVAGADGGRLAALMAAEASRQMLRAAAAGAEPTVGARAGLAVDAGLSGLSLLIGIATLGGWSAKPVNIFGDGASDAPSWSEVERDADLLALHMLAAAGHAQAWEFLPSAQSADGRQRLQAEAARIDAPPSPELAAILRRLR